MNLNGKRYFMDRPPPPPGKPALKAEIYELGYWRKHPNLHGYIVQEFADGKDECQEIPLGEDELIQIMEAVKANELPHTTGFFFGVSEGTTEESPKISASCRMPWSGCAQRRKAFGEACITRRAGNCQILRRATRDRLFAGCSTKHLSFPRASAVLTPGAEDKRCL
jgi:hypothetical protein